LSLPSLLSLPASFFKVLQLPQKYNRFHFPAPCFMKNASASDFSKSQNASEFASASTSLGTRNYFQGKAQNKSN